MVKLLTLEKYSFGVGDRFAHQAKAQLPATTRAAADAAVKALHWQKPYHVDADHIRRETVDRFVPHADF